MTYNKIQLEILTKMAENGDRQSTKLLLNYYCDRAKKFGKQEDIENYFNYSYLYISQNSIHFISKEMNPIFYVEAVVTQKKLTEEFGTYDIEEFRSDKDKYMANFRNYHRILLQKDSESLSKFINDFNSIQEDDKQFILNDGSENQKNGKICTIC